VRPGSGEQRASRPWCNLPGLLTARAQLPKSRAARLLIALALLLACAPARAQEAPRVEWKPYWREFGWEDYVLTSVSSLVIVGTQLIPEDRDRWQPYGFGFDEAARDALRLESEHGELYARDTSDVLMMLSVAYPFLVDSLSVAWWHHGNEQVAREIGLISAETLAVTSAVQSIVSGVTSRERPYGRRCGEDLSDETLYCKERNRYRSFFSGHTSISFASAATLCVHHQHIPLYGGGSGEQFACALGFVNAAAVGLLRVAGDRHYLSDVLVGAGIGTLTGLTVPWFLHYRPSRSRGFPADLSLRVSPLPGGLSVGGDF